MRRWFDARNGTLSRRATVAVVAVAILLAALISQWTEGAGPLGPAGVFFGAVLLVSIVAGASAGFVITVAGTALILLLFTDERASFELTDRGSLADVVAFAGISTTLSLVLARLDTARQRAQRALAKVDAMVRYAPTGMAFVDHERRLLEMNDSMAAIGVGMGTDAIGMRLDDMPGVSPEALRLVNEVLATGESRLDVPLESAGTELLAGYYPVLAADGTIRGVGILAREVSAERQRDVLFDRVSRLQELTAALAPAGTVDEVIATAVRSIQRAVDARGASLCLLEGETARIAGSIGYPDEVGERGCDFPLTEDEPLAQAIVTGRSVLIGSRDEILERCPHLEGSLVWGRSTALAAVPLRGESAVIGAVGISFAEERVFDSDLEAFLVAIATQCASAFERAEAFEAERSARQSAEAANRRLRYLSEATMVLAQSLNPETLMQRLAELAVPALSEWCTVHLVEGDHAYPIAMASENRDATAAVRDLSERHPVPIDAPAGLGAVVRTGRPIVLRSVTKEAVEASSDEHEIIDLLSRLRSIAIVPMTFQGRVLGTVTLANATDRDLSDADVELAGELAARAAQAVTNARLYQERTKVASTLQATLLPPVPTIIPGVDIATRYVPAAEGLDVGGDFYDVIRLGTVEQPSPTWALVIGDVRGKGADAAAITGIARATIRATALDEHSPAEMLRTLNQVLLAAAHDDRIATETGEPRFCTACVVTATPTPDGADLVVSAGGHPLPYVVRADGRIEQVGAHGGLIGVFAALDVSDVRATLHAGDALVLYTDGITEQHRGRVFFDEAGLVGVLSTSAGTTAEELAHRVETRARGYAGAQARDDLAVLIARIPDRATSGVIGRRFLPDDESAALEGRRFVTAAFAARGGDDIVDRATLLTSELVTNALLHGAPPVHIEVLEVDDGLRVSVTDEHPVMPTRRPTLRDDEHGRGLVLVEAIADRWGVDARPPGKSVWFELTT